MNEKMILLKSDIEKDEAQIAQIYAKLDGDDAVPASAEQAIIVGYYLHNLYTAFEHLCTLVAAAFENQIDDRTQWHSLLLRRMTQDISGIRPRLLSDETARCLDELRAFRHVFRSAYSLNLDNEKLAIVLRYARQLRVLYPADLAKFKTFLENV